MPEEMHEEKDPYSDFAADLTALINKHSLENRFDAPDIVIAEHLIDTLKSLEAYQIRLKWRLQGGGALKRVEGTGKITRDA